MIKTLFENIKKDNISEWSAVCAYYTILSFIPFIMIVITLIQYTGVSPDILFEVISNIVPASMNEMVYIQNQLEQYQFHLYLRFGQQVEDFLH